MSEKNRAWPFCSKRNSPSESYSFGHQPRHITTSGQVVPTQAQTSNQIGASRHLHTDFSASTLAHRFFRPDICAATFAPRHLRCDNCAPTFAQRHLRPDIQKHLSVSTRSIGTWMLERKCRSAKVGAQVSGRKSRGASVEAEKSVCKWWGANVAAQVSARQIGSFRNTLRIFQTFLPLPSDVDFYIEKLIYRYVDFRLPLPNRWSRGSSVEKLFSFFQTFWWMGNIIGIDNLLIVNEIFHLCFVELIHRNECFTSFWKQEISRLFSFHLS